MKKYSILFIPFRRPHVSYHVFENGYWQIGLLWHLVRLGFGSKVVLGEYFRSVFNEGEQNHGLESQLVTTELCPTQTTEVTHEV